MTQSDHRGISMMLPENSPLFWKTVLDIMTEGVMLVESGGKIVFVNRAMETLSGYAREELVGRTCGFLDFDCCPRAPAPEKQGPCPLFRNGKMTSKECTLRRKDGDRLTVLKNAQVLADEEGQAIFAVEVQTDSTKLLQKEQKIFELKRLLSERYGFHGIMGQSPAMQDLFDLVRKAALSNAPVLVYGDSGTGKELVAKAIHKLGHRNKGPFIRVNCGALSESLLESELFGHVKGAFTGADRTTKGRFEAAHSGDIFLDEIGDVPLATQVKLLRVIQEKEFERVGDYRTIRIDVRIIAATHRDLRVLVRKGLFRDDLFYRLNVIPIFIPSLRQRRQDIPLLIEHFIHQIATTTGKKITGVDGQSMEFLTHYDWPGNVRELINVVEYAFVVCTGNLITLSDLPEMSLSRPAIRERNEHDQALQDDKERLIQALVTTGGRKADAARLLGISRQTLWSRIRKYHIDAEQLTC
jgi:two-component system, NtrC family, response regulator HydG